MNHKLDVENQLIDEIHQLSMDKIELVLKIVLSWKEQPLKQPRPIGLAKDEWQIPSSFCEPLPEELINLFEGYEK